MPIRVTIPDNAVALLDAIAAEHVGFTRTNAVLYAISKHAELMAHFKQSAQRTLGAKLADPQPTKPVKLKTDHYGRYLFPDEFAPPPRPEMAEAIYNRFQGLERFRRFAGLGQPENWWWVVPAGDALDEGFWFDSAWRPATPPVEQLLAAQRAQGPTMIETATGWRPLDDVDRLEPMRLEDVVSIPAQDENGDDIVPY
jgi:hypothetical protein